MKTTQVFGFSSVVKFSIEKIKGGKKRKYTILKDGSPVAYFDTEEKARLYSDGLQKGIEWGYSVGYKEFNK